MSLPRGRGGEQGSDGGRRTKPETQAVPQSLARGDGWGRGDGGKGRCGRSISVHLPALTFAMPNGDSRSDRLYDAQKGSQEIANENDSIHFTVYVRQSYNNFSLILKSTDLINRLIACVKTV